MLPGSLANVKNKLEHRALVRTFYRMCKITAYVQFIICNITKVKLSEGGYVQCEHVMSF